MCQVWTGKVRCGVDVSGLDWMCQVWTGYVRCGLNVSGVDWKVRWSGYVNIQTRHQLLDRKQLQT